MVLLTIYYRSINDLLTIWPKARPWARPKAGPGSRPGWVRMGDPGQNSLFWEKLDFAHILAISGPSRPHKWIRLEIPHRMAVVSCQMEPWVRFYDQITVMHQIRPKMLSILTKKPSIFEHLTIACSFE